MKKPYILFQTDFGVGGGASMYGMCKLVDSALHACTLSHTVPTFDVAEAARRLARVMPYWPEGTVFVSVVDPGVGTPRRACVARTANGYYAVTPDNGTLTVIKQHFGIDAVREIDEKVNRYPYTPKVSIFHGRDLFAYCAARLASGIITYEQVGPMYSTDDIVMEPAVADTDILYTGFHGEEINHQKGRPASAVILNDFNHDGRLAMMRGVCRRTCFDMGVYDLPVMAAETAHTSEIVGRVKDDWPTGTVFVVTAGEGPVLYGLTASRHIIVAPGCRAMEPLAAVCGITVTEIQEYHQSGYDNHRQGEGEPELLVSLARCAAELAVNGDAV